MDNLYWRVDCLKSVGEFGTLGQVPDLDGRLIFRRDQQMIICNCNSHTNNFSITILPCADYLKSTWVLMGGSDFNFKTISTTYMSIKASTVGIYSYRLLSGV